MSVRDEKIMSQISRLTALFLNTRASGKSLITVTEVGLGDRAQEATIFISVFPETESESALNFVKRQRAELKEYIQDHLRIKRVPQLDFALARKNSNNE